MRLSENCPSGIYVSPRPNDMYGTFFITLEWHGVFFVHRGLYKEGIFKFYFKIPVNYPEKAPQLFFFTEMFHPLVDKRGQFNLKKCPLSISSILFYLKDSFKTAFLANLQGELTLRLEEDCFNAECLAMFKNEKDLFSKLAAQCAQLSSSESTLFDKISIPIGSRQVVDDVLVFSHLTDQQFQELKSRVLTNES